MQHQAIFIDAVEDGLLDFPGKQFERAIVYFGRNNGDLMLSAYCVGLVPDEDAVMGHICIGVPWSKEKNLKRHCLCISDLENCITKSGAIV